MRLVRLLKISDFLTFASTAAGILAMTFAIENRHTIAAIMLLVAVCFDYFDGKSAKRLKIANEFGKNLDSLSDAISFGVAPALFVYTLYHDSFFIPIYIIFVIAGIIRLGHFNVISPSKFFSGLPITVNGFLIPFLYFMRVHEYVFYGYLLLSSILMLSGIKVRKL